LTLSLSLKAKETEGGTIWGLIALEVVIARLDITAELEQVVLALKRRKAHEIRNFLLLKSEENIEGKVALLFLLCFLLKIRVKATSLASGTSPAISILGENIGTRSGP